MYEPDKSQNYDFAHEITQIVRNRDETEYYLTGGEMDISRQVRDECIDTLIDPKSRYYDQGGIETLDIIQAKLTPEEFIGYLKGNGIKYMCRMGWKGDELRDAEKVIVYMNKLIATRNERDRRKEPRTPKHYRELVKRMREDK